MVHWLLKRTLNLEIDKAYAELKASLVQKGCKIISETPPNTSLLSKARFGECRPPQPKKPWTSFLHPRILEPKSPVSSRLSSDWKNITIVGCALAAVLVGLCLWMALDLTAFMTRAKHFLELASLRQRQRRCFSCSKLRQPDESSCGFPLSHHSFGSGSRRLRLQEESTGSCRKPSTPSQTRKQPLRHKSSKRF